MSDILLEGALEAGRRAWADAAQSGGSAPHRLRDVAVEAAVKYTLEHSASESDIATDE